MNQLSMFEFIDELNQTSLFDFIPDNTSELDTLSEHDMIKAISEATGLIFSKHEADWLKSGYSEFKAKRGKYTFSAHFSNYFPEVNEGKKHISIGFSYNLGGGGSPCDSLEEAINRMKYYIQESKKV